MLGEADFVSLHPALVPSTRGMIGDEAFAHMKSTAFLVNCARGPIVDTPGRSSGPWTRAGSRDVRSTRRIPSRCPTRTTARPGERDPHAARRVVQRASLVGLQTGAPSEVRRVLTGEWPVHVVNPAVRGKTRAGL